MVRGPGLDARLAAPSRPSRAAILVVALGSLVVVGLEALFLAERVEAALGGYLLAYVAFTALGVRLPDVVAVLQAFALLAVFRLVNLAVPAFTDLTVYWLPLVYLALLPAAALAVRSTEPATGQFGDETGLGAAVTPVRSVGGRPLRRIALVLPPVLLASIVLAFGQLELGVAGSLLEDRTTSALLVLGGVVALAALVEELLYRGLLQRAVADHLGPVAGVAVGSVLFAAMALPGRPAAVGVALVAGIVYGTAYEYAETLAVPVLGHVVVNLLLFVVLPG